MLISNIVHSTLLCVSFILQFQNQTVVTEEENIEKEDIDTKPSENNNTNIIDSENEQMIKEPDDGNNEALGQTRFFINFSLLYMLSYSMTFDLHVCAFSNHYFQETIF